MGKRMTTLLALCCALVTNLFTQSFDPDFQPFVTRPGDAGDLAILPDGRFYAAGGFSMANREARPNVARFLPDGALDESFQPAVNFSPVALAVQADGKVVLAGSYTDEGAPEGMTVIRLNVNGSLDDSFQAGFTSQGTFADIAVEAGGTILVGGSFSNFDGQATQGVIRLNNSGALQDIIPLSAGGAVFVSSLLTQDNG
ncbi:MAG: delta-60 repeat domain-containing protein, partial [Phaeodactylibacter sp.]|nr:delta-60 repeat domain-containing protein [Phaeodactylibacter sp.]